MGYKINNNIQTAINTLILKTKSYIFWCSRKNKKPNIFELQIRAKQLYTAQQTLSYLNNKNDLFSKNWHQMSQNLNQNPNIHHPSNIPSPNLFRNIQTPPKSPYIISNYSKNRKNILSMFYNVILLLYCFCFLFNSAIM